MSLISLLVIIIVLGLVYWLITMLPLPAPFKMIAIVIFIVICILVLLGMIGIIDIGHVRIH
jgi:hypothetical protein